MLKPNNLSKSQEVIVYLLFDDRDQCLGVYDSLQQLSKSFDEYWFPRLPKETFSYQKWKVGNVKMLEWDWVYIPKDTNHRTSIRYGTSLPPPEFWGINYLHQDWFDKIK